MGTSCATLQMRLAAAESEARECACKGNWRALLKECLPLEGGRFRNRIGHEYTFIGLMDGFDDYYYVLFSPQQGVALLSCVGSIENHGFEQIDTAGHPHDPFLPETP